MYGHKYKHKSIETSKQNWLWCLMSTLHVKMGVESFTTKFITDNSFSTFNFWSFVFNRLCVLCTVSLFHHFAKNEKKKKFLFVERVRHAPAYLVWLTDNTLLTQIMRSVKRSRNWILILERERYILNNMFWWLFGRTWTPRHLFPFP